MVARTRPSAISADRRSPSTCRHRWPAPHPGQLPRAKGFCWSCSSAITARFVKAIIDRLIRDYRETGRTRHRLRGDRGNDVAAYPDDPGNDEELAFFPYLHDAAGGGQSLWGGVHA